MRIVAVEHDGERADAKARYMALRTKARIDEAAERGEDYTDGLDADLAAEMLSYFRAGKVVLPYQLLRFAGAGRSDKRGPNPYKNRQRDDAIAGAIRELAESGLPVKESRDGFDACAIVGEVLNMDPNNVAKIWNRGPGLDQNAMKESRQK